MKKHYDAVILSPHFDDAVFSCGSLIAQLSATDSSVLVLNLFTEFQCDGGESSNKFFNDGRSDEEDNAAKCLRFDTCSVGLIDAPARYKLYQQPSNLFLPQAAGDPIDVDEIVERLQESLQGINYKCLYVPLAVGWHVDHVLCHLAGRKLNPQSDLLFYEDAPYCFIPSFTSYRLDELGTGIVSKMPAQGRLKKFRTLFSAIAQSSLSHSIPSAFRPFACAAIALYLQRLPTRHPMTSEPLRLSEELAAFDTAGLDIKIDGCACYASQLPEFFEDSDIMSAHYRRHAEAISPASDYVERYWKIDDSSA